MKNYLFIVKFETDISYVTYSHKANNSSGRLLTHLRRQLIFPFFFVSNFAENVTSHTYGVENDNNSERANFDKLEYHFFFYVCIRISPSSRSLNFIWCVLSLFFLIPLALPPLFIAIIRVTIRTTIMINVNSR